MKHGIDSDTSGHETQPPLPDGCFGTTVSWEKKYRVFIFFYDGTLPLMCVNVGQLSKKQLW